MLPNRLERRISALREGNFEDFAFERLKSAMQRFRMWQDSCRCGKILATRDDHSSAYQRIASKNREELRECRPAASNVPFIDFETSNTRWYITESSRKETVRIDEEEARKFLEYLEKCMTDKYASVGIINIPKADKAVLTVVFNNNWESRPQDSSARALKIFGKPIDVKVVSVSELSAVTLSNDCQ
ncbi:hypothetical protein FGB62_48g12 [Gracilaria domingensis]|nr:hypothetical protein FGB62_48g12 [Gracilaria domingensis]